MTGDPQLGNESDMKSAQADMIAGWISGAAGILASNPLEVVKIRLQTQRHSYSPPPSSFATASALSPSSTSPSSASSSSAFSTPTPTTSLSSSSASSKTSFLANTHPSIPLTSSSCSTIAGRPTPSNNPTFTAKAISAVSSSSSLIPPKQVYEPKQTVFGQLWRQGGVKFLFAGAGGPILGLAFIDAGYFVTYGRCMTGLGQDRQNPSNLSKVFVSGAVAGAVCALLETPIEVVKCRAQAEYQPNARQMKGSWEIARKLLRKEGLSGFYVGGLPTALRDSISSGIFFSSYFWIRRALRGNRAGKSTKSHEEMASILAAGGIAGVLSAVIPYPIDIIKTRLQTANISARSGSGGIRLSVAQAAREIYAEAASTGSMYGLSGFARGLAPTIASSFVGSAVTIGMFEVLVDVLGRHEDG